MFPGVRVPRFVDPVVRAFSDQAPLLPTFTTVDFDPRVEFVRFVLNYYRANCGLNTLRPMMSESGNTKVQPSELFRRFLTQLRIENPGIKKTEALGMVRQLWDDSTRKSAEPRTAGSDDGKPYSETLKTLKSYDAFRLKGYSVEKAIDATAGKITRVTHRNAKNIRRSIKNAV